ncbi:MAG TPA: nicotinamide-nucleotide amidohydrolase family protein [Galbitalea sp.]|nr:nicotinamide-nucleotide amidohydrolase family protein [Galbitalea sp.]
MSSHQTPSAAEIIAELTRLELSIAVAESLTGGLLVAELVSVPGASTVVRGAVVAYSTALKHSLLGVNASLLSEYGAVYPDVAAQMAEGVRVACAIDGELADIGLSTTGVAGPDPQDGQPVGTVFIGVATDSGTRVTALELGGTRETIRRRVVYESLEQVRKALSSGEFSPERPA